MKLLEFVKANLGDMKIHPWQESLVEMLEDNFDKLSLDLRDNMNFFAAHPRFIGVDWAAGHGFIRGEVYRRVGNVVWVRFKTVELERIR